MTRQLTFAFPGKLETNTGGYAYDRRLIGSLRDKGWSVHPLPLGSGFPAPTEAAKTQAMHLLSALPDGAKVLIDGLAFGVLSDWARQEANRLQIVALVHHPLALETGLNDDQKRYFRQSEQTALAQAAHIIATSDMTARELSAHYAVAPEKITVAMPGTDPVSRSKGNPECPHILTVGTLTQRKGHDILLSALKQIENLRWSATIIGSKMLDPRTADQLHHQCRELGLQKRVTLAGECDDISARFASADIFALASRYEGYGMVFAEALAHGLPIVACHAGAVPDVVPEKAGLLVPVDNVNAFAKALRYLIDDQKSRQEMAGAAFLAGQALPDWHQTANIVSNRLETL